MRCVGFCSNALGQSMPRTAILRHSGSALSHPSSTFQDRLGSSLGKLKIANKVETAIGEPTTSFCRLLA